jgi:hypothetical protein
VKNENKQIDLINKSTDETNKANDAFTKTLTRHRRPAESDRDRPGLNRPGRPAV